MSARRQKAWSQHATPRGPADQGRAARQAQVETALAETKLFSAARRLSSAARLLSSIIPPVESHMHFGGGVWRSLHIRFWILHECQDEFHARHRINKGLSGASSRWAPWIDAQPRSFDQAVAEIERDFREAMAWACANVPAMEMLRFVASWPHGDWLPVSGEARP